MSINAVEGYPLEDFNAEAVRNQISEAQKIAGGSGSEQDIAEAKIELEVRTARQLRMDSRPSRRMSHWNGVESADNVTGLGELAGRDEVAKPIDA